MSVRCGVLVRRVIALGQLPFAFVVASCAGEGDTTRRDSSGVPIVENAKPILSDAERITLSSTPVLAIGTQAGEDYQLIRVRGAVRMPDGRVGVANGGSAQLRFYDSTGRFVKAAGRRGQGPGEFRSLSFVARVQGDTLIAGPYQGRGSVFTGEGDYIRDINLNESHVTLPAGQVETIAWYSTKRKLLGSFKHEGEKHPAGERWIQNFALAVSGPDSAASRVVGSFPHAVYTTPERGRETPWFSPYVRIAHNSSVFYVGFGDTYSIRVFTESGEPVHNIERAWTPAPITSDDVEQLVAHQRKGWAGNAPDLVAGWERWLRNEPMSETVPAYAQLIADRVGRLWVREAAVIDEIAGDWMAGTPQKGSKWSVFDREGRWLCEVHMPALFLPMEIGADYVLGTARGEDDVEIVTMYRLSGGG